MSGRATYDVWRLLLYPDDPTHVKALEMLNKRLIHSKWDVYWMPHDKDVWTKEDEEENPEHKEGELKKAHIHAIVFTEKRRAVRTVAEILQIEQRHVQPSYDVEGDMDYLTHGGPRGEGKYQYNKEDVKANSKIDYITRMHMCASRGMSEEDKLIKVLDIIDRMKAECLETGTVIFDFDDVIRQATKQGLGGYVARNHQSIQKSIDKANLVLNDIFAKKREVMRGFEPLCDDVESPFEEERN